MSLKLGKRFHSSTLGDFYFDPETMEVTVLIEHEGVNIHEWRGKPRNLLEAYSEAMPKIMDAYTQAMSERFTGFIESVKPQLDDLSGKIDEASEHLNIVKELVTPDENKKLVLPEKLSEAYGEITQKLNEIDEIFNTRISPFFRLGSEPQLVPHVKVYLKIRNMFGQALAILKKRTKGD